MATESCRCDKNHSQDFFNRARECFANAIANQRDGDTGNALKYARECIELLKGFNTAEETAAGKVVTVDGHIICEPSYLHVDTAKRRFIGEGILL